MGDLVHCSGLRAILSGTLGRLSFSPQQILGSAVLRCLVITLIFRQGDDCAPDEEGMELSSIQAVQEEARPITGGGNNKQEPPGDCPGRLLSQ